MSDIGNRIRRYRLGRYGAPGDSGRSRVRWAWPLLGLWMIYVAFASDHSLYRIWTLGVENTRIHRELTGLQTQVEHLEKTMDSPKALRRVAEDSLRARGWVAPGEIVYRIGSAPAESLGR
jgi:hypothetical protein